MKDNANRETVSDALDAVQGVVEVQVSLLRASATVWHTLRCHAADLIEAVERAGFGANPGNGQRPA